MSWQTLDPDWQMTVLFLLALASTGLFMKLIALFTAGTSSKTNWAFVCSPLLSPDSPKRSRPLSATPRLVLRMALFLAGILLYYWIYWHVVRTFAIRGILLSYLAAPAVLLIGEWAVAIVALLWLPSGRLLPPLHHQPLLARGVADFWGRRWNRWFRDWFRSVIFVPMRHRPLLALFLVFAVSGLMHEWVINVSLYFVTGRKFFGSMMLYFLLQPAGVLIERRFLKRNARARILFVWLVVLAPASLILNEGLLRALHLWPE